MAMFRSDGEKNEFWFPSFPTQLDNLGYVSTLSDSIGTFFQVTLSQTKLSNILREPFY